MPRLYRGMKLRFGEFTLDRATRQLLNAGAERHLEPKAFELLDLLVGRRPDAVAKSEIRDRLWPKTFVSESNLTDLGALPGGASSAATWVSILTASAEG